MKARINTHAFRQTCLQSDALGVLGSIAHPLREAGDYRGSVRLRGAEVAAFRVRVDAEAPEQQADVDLAALATARRRLGGFSEEPAYRVRPGGWLVLFVSEGPGGFSVRLDRVGKKGGSFDSRELGEGDVFIASLLRPGRYRLSDRHHKYEGTIRVSYPEPGKAPYRPKPPVSVRVTAKGFEPAEVAVGPAQGVVLTVESPKSALVVDCVEPDDGPEKRRDGRDRGKFRWVNPAHAGRQRGRRKAAG